MFSFTRERSDRTGCGRRQGSPLRSDRSRGKALTAVLARSEQFNYPGEWEQRKLTVPNQ
jgi:hypothetical protein